MGAGTIARCDARLAGAHHARDPARRSASSTTLRYRLAAPLIRDERDVGRLGAATAWPPPTRSAATFAGRAILVDVDEAPSRPPRASSARDDASTLTADLNAPAEVERVRARADRRRRRRAPSRASRSSSTCGRSSRSSRCSPSSPRTTTRPCFSASRTTRSGRSRTRTTRRCGARARSTSCAACSRGHASLGAAGRAAARGSCPPATPATTTPTSPRRPGRVPTHFLAAFGPRAAELGAHAARRAGRPGRAAPLGAPARGLPRVLQASSTSRAAQPRWFEEWRAYIHDLEDRLGLPPSGASPDELPSARRVKVAFLVNDLQLSGGVGVVVAPRPPARAPPRLRRRRSSSCATQEAPRWGYDALPEVSVLTLDEARERRFDVAVATWWETTFSLFQVPAERYAYFVQSLEDRFYHPDQPERLGAALTSTCRSRSSPRRRGSPTTLAELRPDAPVHLRPQRDRQGRLRRRSSGRARARRSAARAHRGQPDRVVQGRRARRSRRCARCAEPHHVTVVTGSREALRDDADVDEVVGPLQPARDGRAPTAESDVVLKLSRVEGMYGPPLEGFHWGATCVTTPVTGHDEYVEHGWNASSPTGTTCRERRAARPAGARPAAAALPAHERAGDRARVAGWEQSAQLMAMALQRIATEAAAARRRRPPRRCWPTCAPASRQYDRHLQSEREYRARSQRSSASRSCRSSRRRAAVQPGRAAHRGTVGDPDREEAPRR